MGAAVSGLKWIGSKISHFFGLYDVRALEAAISAPKAVAVLPAPPSVTPNLKVPSVVKFPVVMVAGMVTMLAMLVAGMRQWKKWNTSVVSMETDKMLVVDVELVDMDADVPCPTSAVWCPRAVPHCF